MLNVKIPQRKKKSSESLLFESRSKVLYTSNTSLANANVAVWTFQFVLRKARFRVISSRLTASQQKKKKKTETGVKKSSRLNLYIPTPRVGLIQTKLHLVSGIPLDCLRPHAGENRREREPAVVRSIVMVGATAEGEEQAIWEENPVT